MRKLTPRDRARLAKFMSERRKGKMRAIRAKQGAQPKKAR